MRVTRACTLDHFCRFVAQILFSMSDVIPVAVQVPSYPPSPTGTLRSISAAV